MRDVNAPSQPATRTSPTRTGPGYRLARNAIAIVAWGFVAAVLVQVYLAGIGVFRQDWELHRNFGHLLEIVSIVLLILLIVVRGSRLQIGLAALLIVLVVGQNIFIGLRTSNPELAALHPVNAVVILVASIVLARTTWRLGGFTEL